MDIHWKDNLDFLENNICRLVLTEDMEELTAMYAWANRRLNEIYFERRKEIMEGK